MGKSHVLTTLPSAVYEDLQKIYSSKAELNHAIRFLDNLKKRSLKENGMVTSFVSTPKNYILKLYNGKYNTWIKPLIENGFIISNNFYYHYGPKDNRKGVALKYKLNGAKFTQKFLDVNKGIEEGIEKGGDNKDCQYRNTFDKPLISTVSYSVKEAKMTEYEKEVSQFVKEDLKQLYVDYPKLKKISLDYITEYDVDKLVITNNIEAEAIEVLLIKEDGKENKFYISAEKAVQKAKFLGYEIYKDKDNYYMMSKERLTSMKKEAMWFSYKDSLVRLKNGYFYGRRNTTNNRLDTNLTNLPGFMCKEIMAQNDLVQLDLANSQFSILSYTLEDKLDKEDFTKFKQSAYTGTLYEFVQKELNSRDRISAKKGMFELMFSHQSNSTVRKQKLKSIFPSVVDYVDTYKERHGYKQFPISLQRMEADIFIDKIWYKLKELGYFCLSKHDAIICKREDLEFVRNFITETFKEINFKGKMVQE